MFEQLKTKRKLEKAKAMFIDALNKDTKWQQEARDDFKFRNGDQWSDEEKQILEEELRPVLTFNLTKSSIDLIMGMNEDNRIVHRASPTEPSDAFLCEETRGLDVPTVQFCDQYFLLCASTGFLFFSAPPGSHWSQHRIRFLI